MNGGHLQAASPEKNAGTSWGLVEEFIVEIEGARKDCDITRWGQFSEIKDIKEEIAYASRGALQEVA